MVEDILDLSKIQFGKFEIWEDWFVFDKLVQEVLEMCQFQADLKGIQLLRIL